MSGSIASESILVVDDDPDVRVVLIDALSQDGRDVDVACSGVLALDQLRQQSYGLVISGLSLRDLDARAFYYEAVREHPALRGRFVFISGTAPRRGMRAFLRETAAPALSKPFDPDAVRRTVKEMLGLDRGGETTSGQSPARSADR